MDGIGWDKAGALCVKALLANRPLSLNMRKEPTEQRKGSVGFFLGFRVLGFGCSCAAPMPAFG
jgi:hypothetical protein